MCHRADGLTPADLSDAILATPARDLHKVLGNVGRNPQISSFVYVTVLERLKDIAGPPQAAVNAARDLAATAVLRFCDEIAANQYRFLSVDLLTHFTGQDPSTLYGLALKELGARNDLLDAHACLDLVIKIAQWLSPVEAREVFDYALTELDYLNDNDTADGPWHTDLAPPADLPTCVAGYIWTALADPDDGIRWRAAHTVHLLCQLGASNELQALSDLATTRSIRAFSDARLTFYTRHAQLWLLMALERATNDSIAELRPFENMLKSTAFGTDTNLLMRESARQSLAELDRQGAVSLNDSERERLRKLNTPIGNVRPPKAPRQRVQSRPSHTRQEGDYHFDFDFEEHWIERLARCFAMKTDDITHMISKVITTSWNVAARGERHEDQRHVRGIFTTAGVCLPSTWSPDSVPR
jgi:hypothetical protein